MSRTDKYVCFNPKTNEVYFTDYIVDPHKTPYIYNDHEYYPLSESRFLIWEGLNTKRWYHAESTDLRIPQQFKTLLLLLGVSYESKN